MKRSKVVALVAIGIGPLALAACDRRPDCRQGEPQTQDCRPASTGHGGGAHGWGPFGASASTDHGATPGRPGEAATERGGFGGTGEAATGGHGGGEAGGGHGGGGGE